MHKQSGFTLPELLVVFSIMVMMATLVILSWNSQKANRSLTLAQNETVTNLKKIQSYAISSRNITGSTPAKFYLARFQLGSNEYTIDAVDDNYTYQNIETVKLPGSLTITDLALSPTSSSGTGSSPTCAFVIFSAVYGKTYLTNFDDCSTSTIFEVLQSMPALAPYADYDLSIKFGSYEGNDKGITISGLNGRVEAFTSPASSRVGVECDPKVDKCPVECDPKIEKCDAVGDGGLEVIRK